MAHFTFGINVAKVREILPAMSIHMLPKAHSSIRGVFQLRDQVVPCVSLLDHLGAVARDGKQMFPGSVLAETEQEKLTLRRVQEA